MGGRVVFVGAGPGDPRLATRAAVEALAACDVVVVAPGVSPELLDLAPVEVERVAGGVPGVEGARLVARGRDARVVRLVREDPLLGRGEDEIAAVARAGIPFEIVPGLTLAGVLPSFGGFPLTRGGDITPSYAVVDARGEVGLHGWDYLATATDTLVIATTRARLRDVVDSLVYAGRPRDTPAALFTDAATSRQRVEEAHLGEVGSRASGSAFAPPARDELAWLVVGEVLTQRSHLVSKDARPLAGRRVLVTRAQDQAGVTARLLRDRGAEPIVVPTIVVRDPEDRAPMERAVGALPAGADVAVFTSANGVDRTFAELGRQDRDARAFAGLTVAAIGPGTAAALAAHGVRADVVAKELRGEGLADALLAVLRPQSRVVLFRAKVAREVLPDTLRAAGHAVEVVPVYETHGAPAEVAEGLARRLAAREIDAVLLTSASTVDSLCDLLGDRAGELLAGVVLASIGPITAEAASKRGLHVEVSAEPHTLDALVASLERRFADRD